jgi:hypothetical protein
MRGMESSPRYWFPATRYGWGWGAPSTWQGWLVLAGYVVTIAVPALLLPDRPRIVGAVAATATLLLLWICLARGEPPRWRWGDR